MKISPARLREIAWLICDIDGVLTDGRLWLDANGKVSKSFDVQDGLGIKAVLRHGLRVSWVSGGTSEVAYHRGNMLGVEDIHLGVGDKLAVVDELRQAYGMKWSQVAYIGDDFVDLTVMQKVGMAVAVPNAIEEIKSIAHVCTQCAGGHGAVREWCDAWLRAKDD